MTPKINTTTTKTPISNISIFPTLDTIEEAEELILNQAKVTSREFHKNTWISLLEAYKNTLLKSLNNTK